MKDERFALNIVPCCPRNNCSKYKIFDKCYHKVNIQHVLNRRNYYKVDLQSKSYLIVTGIIIQSLKLIG